MRSVRFAILVLLVAASLGVLLLAGNQVSGISYTGRLESGEKGIVDEILQNDAAQVLQSYHLRQLEKSDVGLPTAPAYITGQNHPNAERFFYVDAMGNVTIKGLSDKNVPPDFSQKCVLFADSRLTWFKARLLFEAFIEENIQYIYLAGLTAEKHIAYILIEIVRPGQFRVYPNCITLLNDRQSYYYHEDEGHILEFADLASFKKAVEKAKETALASEPFMRLLARDNVSFGAAYRVATMFKPAGAHPIAIISRTDDREILLEDVAHELNRQKKKNQEEKK